MAKVKRKRLRIVSPLLKRALALLLVLKSLIKPNIRLPRKKHKYYEELIIDGKSTQGTDTSFIPENPLQRVLWLISMVKMFLSPKVPTMICTKYGYIRIIIRYIMIRKTIFFISIAHNGSGANAYEVCWQIVKGEYKTRIIGEPF